VTVAPVAATTTLDLRIGRARIPTTRTCGKCKSELPATMKFCDRCGTEQTAPLVADRACPSCDAPVGATKAFCEACGKPVPKLAAGEVALLTSDGHSVELDVVVRVRGPADALDKDQLLSALGIAAASYTRTVGFGALATSPTFQALEAALRDKAMPLVTSQGLELAFVTVVDVRSASGDWLLQARADLNRARAENAVGREWLAERAEEVDLLGLTLGQELARQRAVFEHRRQGQSLADASAELDVADARRKALREQGIKQADRSVARADSAAKREDEMTGLDHAAKVAGVGREMDAAKRRHDVALGSEAARARADDEAYQARARADVAFDDAERRARLAAEMAELEQKHQIAKLQAMAEIDQRMAAQEHGHTKELREMMKDLDERRMIALQAAELAKSEGGGAAWANALGAAESEKRLDQAEKHAAEMRALLEKQADRMEALAGRAMDGVASARKESAAIQAGSMDAMAQVAASRAASPPVIAAVGAGAAGATKACAGCGTQLRADAQFCGSCGKSQP
jgi:predicted amidophosphoribosyltransferase